MIDKFGADERNNVKTIFQDIAPRLSGNTAFNGIIEYPVQDGFEIALLESVTPYGVKLNDGLGGWANKRNRRTGQLLKGWFTEVCYGAGLDYLRGKGGYYNSINATKESLVKEAQDNPLRQRIYIDQITESGDVNELD